MVDRVQRTFLSPITFEELPFESPTELRPVTIARADGSKVLLVNPSTEFKVILDKSDATPYLAAQTMMAAYHNAGLPGVYNVVQQNGRVDVTTTQVLGLNGSMRNVIPLMSRPVSFPLATRKVWETLQILVDQVAHESGVRFILLDPVFGDDDRVELASNGESAADVISNISAKTSMPLSFQCLYAASEKTYYLNIQAVIPPNRPGKTAIHGFRVQSPVTGPQNSPYFTKDK